MNRRFAFAVDNLAVPDQAVVVLAGDILNAVVIYVEEVETEAQRAARH